MTASASSTSPRPASQLPAEPPTPRKLKRTLRVAQLHEGARQRLHDLVVHRAAVLRVRVAQHGHARAARRGVVDGALERAGRAGDLPRCGLGFTGSSPTLGGSSRPLHDLAVLQVRFDDLVDVLLSTKVYQVSSG
jgi:hypothetical protein